MSRRLPVLSELGAEFLLSYAKLGHDSYDELRRLGFHKERSGPVRRLKDGRLRLHTTWTRTVLGVRQVVRFSETFRRP